jgi:hypothetical protein
MATPSPFGVRSIVEDCEFTTALHSYKSFPAKHLSPEKHWMLQLTQLPRFVFKVTRSAWIPFLT